MKQQISPYCMSTTATDISNMDVWMHLLKLRLHFWLEISTEVRILARSMFWIHMGHLGRWKLHKVDSTYVKLSACHAVHWPFLALTKGHHIFYGAWVMDEFKCQRTEALKWWLMVRSTILQRKIKQHSQRSQKVMYIIFITHEQSVPEHPTAYHTRINKTYFVKCYMMIHVLASVRNM
jgi:hypothetical protein